MKLLKKTLRALLFLVLGLLVLVLIWWVWPERTPKIKSTNGTSVSTIDYIALGGVEQCVLIRSQNTNNPILLFLHGGPGMPMMYLAHEFQKPLEANFTLVQWDRRGAGKTYSRNKPTIESMNTRQVINDTYALIDTLRTRYSQDKIVLAGHSFGTYLGSIMVMERPDLFSAYISIGQVVDEDKTPAIQERWIRQQANALGRTEIITKLDEFEKLNFESWLFEFGGELKNSASFFPLLWSGLQAPEYTLPEVLDVAKGSSFSSSHMKLNILSESVRSEIIEYKVPVYFFVGKSDYTTPHELITDYYELIKAPKKEIIYFENSAHFPFYEEPEKFCEEVNKIRFTLK